jgi:hypothetical protein
MPGNPLHPQGVTITGRPRRPGGGLRLSASVCGEIIEHGISPLRPRISPPVVGQGVDISQIISDYNFICH